MNRPTLKDQGLISFMNKAIDKHKKEKLTYFLVGADGEVLEASEAQIKEYIETREPSLLNCNDR